MALEDDGVELAAPVEVTGIEEAGGTVAGLTTSDERVPAHRVVVAAGAWSGVLGSWAPPVRPVKGQILRLSGPAQPLLAQRVVRTPRCYVVCRDSGEIVIGATVEERGFDTTVTAGAVHRLLEAAWEVLPDVEERELVEARAALRPGTPDNCPAIGACGPKGLLWATGHHRNGVLLAPITARRDRGPARGTRRSGRRRAVLARPLRAPARARREPSLNVVLNGEPCELPDGCSVSGAVEASGAEPEGRGVAVAIDGEVLPRGRWDAVELQRRPARGGAPGGAGWLTR